jgi:hypothetical protein
MEQHTDTAQKRSKDVPPGGFSSRTIILLALAAITIFMALFAAVVLVATADLTASPETRGAAERAACQEKLADVHEHLEAYAKEHGGLYPPLSDEPGRFAFDAQALRLPKGLLECPSDPLSNEEGGSQSYLYVGFLVRDEREARAYVEAYRQALKAGDAFLWQLVGEDGDPLPRLRAPRPGEAAAPVLMDRPDNHVPVGINVLYNDGSVEFVRIGEGFPAVDWFLQALESLEESAAEPAASN